MISIRVQHTMSRFNVISIPYPNNDTPWKKSSLFSSRLEITTLEGRELVIPPEVMKQCIVELIKS